MTLQLQNQYLSPNSKLMIQGFSDSGSNQLMTVLTLFQCEIIGLQPQLTGGKDIFEHLIKSVSLYAQEFLSGVTLRAENKDETDVIYVEKLPEKNRHLLIWKEKNEDESPKVQWELTTIQLFDLVDVIDQFLNDSRTLPDITLDIQPVSRRYRQKSENLIEQSTPTALGIASFAVAAIALFLIPVPSEIKDPREEDAVIRQQREQVIPENQSPLPNSNPLIPDLPENPQP